MSPIKEMLMSDQGKVTYGSSLKNGNGVSNNHAEVADQGSATGKSSHIFALQNDVVVSTSDSRRN
jgi:hypothetical protein